jgi:hypothetical protein
MAFIDEHRTARGLSSGMSRSKAGSTGIRR